MVNVEVNAQDSIQYFKNPESTPKDDRKGRFTHLNEW